MLSHKHWEFQVDIKPLGEYVRNIEFKINSKNMKLPCSSGQAPGQTSKQNTKNISLTISFQQKGKKKPESNKIAVKSFSKYCSEIEVVAV